MNKEFTLITKTLLYVSRLYLMNTEIHSWTNDLHYNPKNNFMKQGFTLPANDWLSESSIMTSWTQNILYESKKQMFTLHNKELFGIWEI